MNQKQIRVCLAKVFNWQQAGKVCPLLIQFFSKKNQCLIAKKAVKATFMNNYLEIGIHLKIKYSESEKELIVVIQKADSEGRSLGLVGEVQINLDQVLLRKIKYFPIGDMDKVLQVEVSETGAARSENIQNKNKKEVVKRRNQQFLQQRRRFLQNVSQTQKILKRTFSEKIMSLLNEKNSETGEQYSAMQSNNPPTQNNELFKNQIDYESIQSGDIGSGDLSKKLNKCTSEYGVKFSKNFGQQEKRGVEQIQRNNKSTHSQQHKLMLNNLNILQSQSKRF